MGLALRVKRDISQDIAQGMTLNAPQLRRLYEDWRVRRCVPIPRRADFDPASLSYILGSLSLFEVLRDPMRFRARVHGTRMSEHLGHEFTGKFLDEAPPNKYYNLVLTHLTDVATHARPSFAWLVDQAREPPTMESESLVLPLSRDGDTVDYLISAAVHHRRFSLNEVTDPVQHIVPLPV
ncbi:MAG TPA: PAS domain-containing protein [Stellaceae bacterium]|nr:PAS domain-containing protein [Stellaceae bacterium]